ncbi:MAG: hypothetical protein Q8922_00180 [Bacteroidota bacterium]|nr:hypothetical protein [Bacteroidota bacterium]MDP4232450.1 hypothetical protein [Bacteroidota bacterium]MDP4241586.1 hypothetical protein [Bacteroidota bacterium]MDP4286330.1 hypothetical protein [Bacteroidota bacterium]
MKLTIPLTPLERRIRLSATLVVIGLAGTLASLLIFHPLAFIGFILTGITVMLVANIYFLIAILRGSGRTTAS